MTITANFILVCTWLSLAVAVVAHESPASPRALGHHAHPDLIQLSHLPVVSAKADDSTGKIETAIQKKKRAFAGKVNNKRYYGDDRGFSRPGALPTKRALILPTGWSSLGCVSEGKSYRALKDFSYVSSTMTVESCLEVCKGQGYSLGGLEWSDECYCSNNWSGGGGVTTDDSSCNMPCVGSSSTTCGGYYTLSAYSYTAPNATTLLTASQCEALANSTSSDVASSALPSASSAYPSASSVYLGASSALPSYAASSAYASGFASAAYPSASAVVSGSAAANLSSLVPTSTVSGSASLPTSSVASTEWEALGCYLDNPTTSGNILTGTKITGQSDMTQATCQTRCAGQGYNFAGLEYGNECWCGDLTTTQLSALKSNAPWCNMPCTGDSSQTCGGGWSLQLFEQVDVTDDSSC